MQRLQLLRCSAALVVGAPALPRCGISSGGFGGGGRSLVPPCAPRPPAPVAPPSPLSAPVQHRPFRGTPPVHMGRRAAKIANRKGKADAIKAKLYGRIGKMIVQTVKSGGGPDPAANGRLAEVLKRAKDVGAPKDLIERNLKRASDAKQADYAELVYEAYGPGGTGFVVEVLTDNVNRSASDVRAAITKGGGKVAEPGSVAFNFARQGLACVVAPAQQEDEVFEAAMNAGAEDIVADEGAEEGDPHRFLVYTPVTSYASALAALKGSGLEVDEAASGLVYRPQAEVTVDDAAREQCEALAERLLALDDVENVYSTCEGFN